MSMDIEEIRSSRGHCNCETRWEHTYFKCQGRQLNIFHGPEDWGREAWDRECRLREIIFHENVEFICALTDNKYPDLWQALHHPRPVFISFIHEEAVRMTDRSFKLDRLPHHAVAEFATESLRFCNMAFIALGKLLRPDMFYQIFLEELTDEDRDVMLQAKNDFEKYKGYFLSGVEWGDEIGNNARRYHPDAVVESVTMPYGTIVVDICTQEIALTSEDEEEVDEEVVEEVDEEREQGRVDSGVAIDDKGEEEIAAARESLAEQLEDDNGQGIESETESLKWSDDPELEEQFNRILDMALPTSDPATPDSTNNTTHEGQTDGTSEPSHINTDSAFPPSFDSPTREAGLSDTSEDETEDTTHNMPERQLDEPAEQGSATGYPTFNANAASMSLSASTPSETEPSTPRFPATTDTSDPDLAAMLEVIQDALNSPLPNMPPAPMTGENQPATATEQNSGRPSTNHQEQDNSPHAEGAEDEEDDSDASTIVDDEARAASTEEANDDDEGESELAKQNPELVTCLLQLVALGRRIQEDRARTEAAEAEGKET